MDLHYWTHQLSDLLGNPGELLSPVQNHTGFHAQWKSGAEHYFVKCYQGDSALAMGKAETNGLMALMATGIVQIPQLYLSAEVLGGFVLVMEWISGDRNARAPKWKKAGEQLATLHANPAGRQFGLSFNNYIGRLPQSNSFHDSWPEFFRDQRLLPLWEPIAGLLDASAHTHLERLLQRLPSLLDYQGRPALLHGDLWNGNLLFNERGNPVFIDPAVCYGVPEMDLAMTRLFGGFPQEFYDAYYGVLPQEPGWEDRQNLYQLYYLLVHVHLFGAEYVPACERILQKFGS